MALSNGIWQQKFSDLHSEQRFRLTHFQEFLICQSYPNLVQRNFFGNFELFVYVSTKRNDLLSDSRNLLLSILQSKTLISMSQGVPDALLDYQHIMIFQSSTRLKRLSVLGREIRNFFVTFRKFSRLFRTFLDVFRPFSAF